MRGYVVALITTVSGLPGPGDAQQCSACLPGRDVRAARLPHLPHHHQPGVNPNADCQADTLPLYQAAIERVHRRHKPSRCARRAAHRLHAPGDSQSRPAGHRRVLGDMPLIALDDFGTGVLIGTHHLPVSSGSSWPESAVESTRSQNITVSCRHSAAGVWRASSDGSL